MRAQPAKDMVLHGGNQRAPDTPAGLGHAQIDQIDHPRIGPFQHRQPDDFALIPDQHALRIAGQNVPQPIF